MFVLLAVLLSKRTLLCVPTLSISQQIPYDPVGLAQLFNASGKDMCDLLQKANTMPGLYHAGGYGHIIHEQTEMAGQSCVGCCSRARPCSLIDCITCCVVLDPPSPTTWTALCWGQWEMNNQPVWAMEWMFIASQSSVTSPCAANGQVGTTACQ